MALNIKKPSVDRLARRAAELRGTGITEAVEAALERDIVELEKAREQRAADLMKVVRVLQAEIAAMPVRDRRSVKEIRDELWDDVLDSHR